MTLPSIEGDGYNHVTSESTNRPHVGVSAAQPGIVGLDIRSTKTPNDTEQHSQADGHTGLVDLSIAKLRAHSALEASYNSEINSLRAPGIHPGSRQGVLEAIDAWIIAPRSKNPDPRRMSMPLLWFFGPTGTGKTSIQREVASRHLKAGRLLASFFFISQSTKVNKKELFVATIAYQISSNVPGLRDFVSSAIQDDPEVFARSLEDQMLCLVFRPLERFHRYSTHNYWWRRLKSSFNAHRGRPVSDKFLQCKAFKERYAEWWNRNIIVVDGIEECNNPKDFDGVGDQRHIVGFMHWATLHPKFPLRFVASSVDENNTIVEAFHNASEVRKIFSLDAYVAFHDIEAYLRDEFSRIRNRHQVGMGVVTTDAMEQEWPGRSVIDLLVAKASKKLFIYASTIIRFIDNLNHDPVDLLERLLASIPKHNTASDQHPYAELDALYTAILHFPPSGTGDADLVRKLIHSIAEKRFDTVLELDTYLSLSPGTAEVALRDHLYPLVYVRAEDSLSSTSEFGVGTIGFYHRSMLDFLGSEERSGDMHMITGIVLPRALRPRYFH